MRFKFLSPMTALVLTWCVLFAGVYSVRSFAAPSESIPRSIEFQGFLSDTSGDALDGAHRMRFGIYTGGVRIWYSEYATVAVNKGYFSVSLGGATQGGSALNPGNGAAIAITNLPITAALLAGVDSSTAVTIELEIDNGGGAFEAL